MYRRCTTGVMPGVTGHSPPHGRYPSPTRYTMVPLPGYTLACHPVSTGSSGLSVQQRAKGVWGRVAARGMLRGVCEPLCAGLCTPGLQTWLAPSTLCSPMPAVPCPCTPKNCSRILILILSVDERRCTSRCTVAYQPARACYRSLRFGSNPCLITPSHPISTRFGINGVVQRGQHAGQLGPSLPCPVVQLSRSRG